MATKDIDLIPYITFAGNCEEALTYYSGILGGTVEIQSRYDNPAMKAPKEYQDKVLHGRLHFGGVSIYASDVFPGGKASGSSGDVALSLSFSGPEEAQKIFDRLAEGGKIGVAFAKQFWGDWHGNLTDKYGIHWMVNC
ncbi:VOC family protein [Compostibacter hankyongensis]|uniref:VOC family protein n=1 Tax=Compostibacter hankyongensis TaxID=1007089 RepID=A0ABP8FXV6_9BACT